MMSRENTNWTKQDVTNRRAECQAEQKRLIVVTRLRARLSANWTNQQLNRLTLAELTLANLTGKTSFVKRDILKKIYI